MERQAKSLNDLSLEECREQLALCWDHFRCCLEVLGGGDAEPCELLSCDEFGDSDDLELFYCCKRAGSILRGIESVRDGAS